MTERFHITPLALVGLKRIERLPIGDSRGWFERTYCFDSFVASGLVKTIAQINRSFTLQIGSVRGMHYQQTPHVETKIVSCLRGKVFDVAVDLRPQSPTFLQWHGEILSEENRFSLLIPDGFAHGFQTLTADCEMLYLHTANFAPGAASGLHPQDPKLAIQWPLPITEMSDGDRNRAMMPVDFQGI